MASFRHFVSFSSKTKCFGAYQRYIYKAYSHKNVDTFCGKLNFPNTLPPLHLANRGLTRLLVVPLTNNIFNYL